MEPYAPLPPEMTFATIEAAIHPFGLRINGALHSASSDSMGGGKTIILLGPMPDFWSIYQRSPEAGDQAADPLDRWSERVIGGIAAQLDAVAAFPFGGAPYHPFIGWALRSGRCWTSPVGLLVHDTAGLLVSFRGALIMDGEWDLPPRPTQPCLDCAAPCRSACPATALTEDGYNVPKCHDFLDQAEGKTCLETGCQVRRACPVGKGSQPVEQSALHMAAFHKPSNS